MGTREGIKGGEPPSWWSKNHSPPPYGVKYKAPPPRPPKGGKNVRKFGFIL